MGGGEDTRLAPEGLSLAELEAALARRFAVRALPRYRAAVTYVDSFDWRLYRAGMMLHTHRRHWTLYGRDGRVTLLRGGPLCRKSCPADAFPEGPMRALLAPVLGARALLPLARVDLRGRQIQLLGPDGALALRLVLEEQRLAEQEQRFCLVRLFPIAGHDDILVELRELLREMGIDQPVSPLVCFEAGCRAVGRKPLDYSPAFSPVLAGEGRDIGDMGAAGGLRQIGLQLLAALRRNLPGVTDDLDTEFLHHFRMALRRSRLLIGLGAAFAPAGRLSPFKAGFAGLTRATGPLRALDALLLAESDCLDRAPPELRPALQDCFAALARRRVGARRRLARRLKDEETAALLDDWELALRDGLPEERSGETLAALASRALRRQSRRTRTEALRLAENPARSPARLRVLCKQLRYYLEFFSTLHPEEATAALLAPLKAAQAILGRLHDAALARRILRQTAARPSGGMQSGANAAAGMALGALMQSLYEEEAPLRQRLAPACAALVTQLSDFAARLDDPQ